jgi:hypothetical protein
MKYFAIYYQESLVVYFDARTVWTCNYWVTILLAYGTCSNHQDPVGGLFIVLDMILQIKNHLKFFTKYILIEDRSP